MQFPKPLACLYLRTFLHFFDNSLVMSGNFAFNTILWLFRWEACFVCFASIVPFSWGLNVRGFRALPILHAPPNIVLEGYCNMWLMPEMLSAFNFTLKLIWCIEAIKCVFTFGLGLCSCHIWIYSERILSLCILRLHHTMPPISK